MSSQSKVILGFLAGAAAGVAVAYLINSEKGEEVIDEIKNLASKIKDTINERVADATGGSRSDVDEEPVGI